MSTPTQDSQKANANYHRIHRDTSQIWTLSKSKLAAYKSFDIERLRRWRKQPYQYISIGFHNEQELRFSYRHLLSNYNGTNWQGLAENFSNTSYKNYHTKEFNTWYTAYMDEILWAEDLVQYLKFLSKPLQDSKFTA